MEIKKTTISYSEVVKYLIYTYVTDYDITKMDAKKLCFTQPSNMTPTEYAEVLSRNTLRFNRV